MAERGGLFGALGIGRRNVAPTQTGGVPGFAIYGGFLEDQEKDAALKGEKRYQTYSEILANTSIVAAGVRFFLNLTAKAGWKVEPNPMTTNEALAIEVAEFVQSAMDDMRTPWPRVIRRAAMFKFYGFSIQEWTAKRRPDGQIGMLDVAPRPQHTITQWDCADDGEILGAVQTSPQTGEDLYLPRGKIVYAVDDSLSDSPEGLGLLRNVVRPARRLEVYEKLEGFGYETDLRGIPIARAPLAELQRMVDNNQISNEEKERRIQFLRDFIKRHVKNPQLGLLLDSAPYQSEDERGQPVNVPQWSIDLLQGGGTTPMEAVAKAIERLNREMARILGVEMLLIGGDGGGSLALHRDKTQTFGLIVSSTLTELAFVMRNDFARPLVLLNGWPEDVVPKMTPEEVQFRDVEQVVAVLTELANAGAPLQPGDPAIDQVRELAGLVGVPQEMVDALIEDAALGRELNAARVDSLRAGEGGDPDDPENQPPPAGEGEED